MDIKPGNSFVDEHNLQVKLADLGIGRRKKAKTIGKTSFAKKFLGTPSYMAPEQLLNDENQRPKREALP